MKKMATMRNILFVVAILGLLIQLLINVFNLENPVVDIKSNSYTYEIPQKDSVEELKIDTVEVSNFQNVSVKSTEQVMEEGQMEYYKKIIQWIIHGKVSDPDQLLLSIRSGEILPENLYWLSSGIMSEEEGESHKGKILCGLVIMNRVESEDFPSTIKEVLFEDGQYASIENGRIYLEQNEESIEAAIEILTDDSINIPSNVVYQSERPLGSGTFCQYGNQYFCYK